eukprot:SM005452S18197  [mRNA]  locus=s5452:35:907:- [translate_table: standard]
MMVAARSKRSLLPPLPQTGDLLTSGPPGLLDATLATAGGPGGGGGGFLAHVRRCSQRQRARVRITLAAVLALAGIAALLLSYSGAASPARWVLRAGGVAGQRRDGELLLRRRLAAATIVCRRKLAACEEAANRPCPPGSGAAGHESSGEQWPAGRVGGGAGCPPLNCTALQIMCEEAELALARPSATGSGVRTTKEDGGPEPTNCEPYGMLSHNRCICPALME